MPIAKQSTWLWFYWVKNQKKFTERERKKCRLLLAFVQQLLRLSPMWSHNLKASSHRLNSQKHALLWSCSRPHSFGPVPSLRLRLGCCSTDWGQEDHPFLCLQTQTAVITQTLTLPVRTSSDVIYLLTLFDFCMIQDLGTLSQILNIGKTVHIQN